MSLVVKGRLGDRLLDKGLVTKTQLEVALAEQRRAHRPLGEILISLGFANQEQIVALLAEDLGLQFLHASDVQPDPLILSALDAHFVRETMAFPIRLDGGELLTLMVEPDDPMRVSAVRSRFPYPLKLAITTEREIQSLLKDHLRATPAHLAQIFKDLASEKSGEDAPIERITEAMLLDGIHRGGTDIHIEPDERVTRVRYRIDGILVSGESLPTDITSAVISRIKILSGLDISERRRPQDGRMRFTADDRVIDMRVSIMPSVDGENVVIRVLDKSSGTVDLGRLGLTEHQRRQLLLISDRSHGLFLVTGPTGSGKTTTLYSILGRIDALRRNVATIEDPVEYRMPLLRQSQVDHSIGFGFKEGLRSLLRQDPDCVLVGEIRDAETADMAIKASMTGHLVFSTLHTNSAIGAIPRLVDIGVDAFLLEESLIGVLAQRLVRKVCSGCATPVEPTEEDVRWLDGDTGRMSRGLGCDRCGGSGYAGRTVIAELLLPDEEMAAAIRSGAGSAEMGRIAAGIGFRDLTADGKSKVRAGATTRAEIERVNRSHRLNREERGEP